MAHCERGEHGCRHAGLYCDNGCLPWYITIAGQQSQGDTLPRGLHRRVALDPRGSRLGPVTSVTGSSGRLYLARTTGPHCNRSQERPAQGPVSAPPPVNGQQLCSCKVALAVHQGPCCHSHQWPPRTRLLHHGSGAGSGPRTFNRVCCHSPPRWRCC